MKTEKLPKKQIHKIGIIEDDTLFSSNLQTFLQKDKFFSVCLQCTSANLALKELTNSSNNIPNILLLDINLPRHSGTEVIQLFKQYNDQMLVIMLTMEEAPEIISRSFENGANGYLLKTESLKNIYHQLLNLIEFNQPAISTLVFQSLLPKSNIKVQNLIKTLTEKEKQIIIMLKKGFMQKEIAVHFKLSINTIQFHLKNIYLKMDVHSNVDLLNLFD